jgi:hypothetical protein
MQVMHKFVLVVALYTMCPADSWQLGRRRAGQLRFGFVAVLEGHIVCMWYQVQKSIV